MRSLGEPQLTQRKVFYYIFSFLSTLFEIFIQFFVLPIAVRKNSSAAHRNHGSNNPIPMQDHPQYDLLTRSTVSDLPEADSDMSLRPALPSSLPLLFRSAPDSGEAQRRHKP